MYVPKISRKIEQWSSTWNTRFPRPIFRAWYRQEIVYSTIIDAPKSVTLTTLTALP